MTPLVLASPGAGQPCGSARAETEAVAAIASPPPPIAAPPSESSSSPTVGSGASSPSLSSSSQQSLQPTPSSPPAAATDASDALRSPAPPTPVSGVEERASVASPTALRERAARVSAPAAKSRPREGSACSDLTRLAAKAASAALKASRGGGTGGESSRDLKGASRSSLQRPSTQQTAKKEEARTFIAKRPPIAAGPVDSPPSMRRQEQRAASPTPAFSEGDFDRPDSSSTCSGEHEECTEDRKASSEGLSPESASPAVRASEGREFSLPSVRPSAKSSTTRVESAVNGGFSSASSRAPRESSRETSTDEASACGTPTTTTPPPRTPTPPTTTPPTGTLLPRAGSRCCTGRPSDEGEAASALPGEECFSGEHSLWGEAALLAAGEGGALCEASPLQRKSDGLLLAEPAAPSEGSGCAEASRRRSSQRSVGALESAASSGESSLGKAGFGGGGLSASSAPSGEARDEELQDAAARESEANASEFQDGRSAGALCAWRDSNDCCRSDALFEGLLADGSFGGEGMHEECVLRVKSAAEKGRARDATDKRSPPPDKANLFTALTTPPTSPSEEGGKTQPLDDEANAAAAAGGVGSSPFIFEESPAPLEEGEGGSSLWRPPSFSCGDGEGAAVCGGDAEIPDLRLQLRGSDDASGGVLDFPSVIPFADPSFPFRDEDSPGACLALSRRTRRDRGFAKMDFFLGEGGGACFSTTASFASSTRRALIASRAASIWNRQSTGTCCCGSSPLRLRQPGLGGCLHSRHRTASSSGCMNHTRVCGSSSCRGGVRQGGAASSWGVEGGSCAGCVSQLSRHAGDRPGSAAPASARGVSPSASRRAAQSCRCGTSLCSHSCEALPSLEEGDSLPAGQPKTQRDSSQGGAGAAGGGSSLSGEEAFASSAAGSSSFLSLDAATAAPNIKPSTQSPPGCQSSASAAAREDSLENLQDSQQGLRQGLQGPAASRSARGGCGCGGSAAGWWISGNDSCGVPSFASDGTEGRGRFVQEQSLTAGAASSPLRLPSLVQKPLDFRREGAPPPSVGGAGLGVSSVSGGDGAEPEGMAAAREGPSPASPSGDSRTFCCFATAGAACASGSFELSPCGARKACECRTDLSTEALGCLYTPRERRCAPLRCWGCACAGEGRSLACGTPPANAGGGCGVRCFESQEPSSSGVLWGEGISPRKTSPPAEALFAARRGLSDGAALGVRSRLSRPSSSSCCSPASSGGGGCGHSQAPCFPSSAQLLLVDSLALSGTNPAVLGAEDDGETIHGEGASLSAAAHRPPFLDESKGNAAASERVHHSASCVLRHLHHNPHSQQQPHHHHHHFHNPPANPHLHQQHLDPRACLRFSEGASSEGCGGGAVSGGAIFGGEDGSQPQPPSSDPLWNSLVSCHKTDNAGTRTPLRGPPFGEAPPPPAGALHPPANVLLPSSLSATEFSQQTPLFARSLPGQAPQAGGASSLWGEDAAFSSMAAAPTGPVLYGASAVLSGQEAAATSTTTPGTPLCRASSRGFAGFEVPTAPASLSASVNAAAGACCLAPNSSPLEAAPSSASSGVCGEGLLSDPPTPHQATPMPGAAGAAMWIPSRGGGPSGRNFNADREAALSAATPAGICARGPEVGEASAGASDSATLAASSPAAPSLPPSSHGGGGGRGSGGNSAFGGVGGVAGGGAVSGGCSRPPPPRVYHVVMCTRRYWRVEWVSPETGRRVYKHFGENRYGGGDRARQVAVKFWAEVRKRSEDGIERGQWEGLTEVTRRVREEGVECFLEQVQQWRGGEGGGGGAASATAAVESAAETSCPSMAASTTTAIHSLHPYTHPHSLPQPHPSNAAQAGEEAAASGRCGLEKTTAEDGPSSGERNTSLLPPGRGRSRVSFCQSSLPSEDGGQTFALKDSAFAEALDGGLASTPTRTASLREETASVGNSGETRAAFAGGASHPTNALLGGGAFFSSSAQDGAPAEQRQPQQSPPGKCAAEEAAAFGGLLSAQTPGGSAGVPFASLGEVSLAASAGPPLPSPSTEEPSGAAFAEPSPKRRSSSPDAQRREESSAAGGNSAALEADGGLESAGRRPPSGTNGLSVNFEEGKGATATESPEGHFTQQTEGQTQISHISSAAGEDSFEGEESLSREPPLKRLKTEDFGGGAKQMSPTSKWNSSPAKDGASFSYETAPPPQGLHEQQQMSVHPTHPLPAGSASKEKEFFAGGLGAAISGGGFASAEGGGAFPDATASFPNAPPAARAAESEASFSSWNLPSQAASASSPAPPISPTAAGALMAATQPQAGTALYAGDSNAGGASAFSPEPMGGGLAYAAAMTPGSAAGGGGAFESATTTAFTAATGEAVGASSALGGCGPPSNEDASQQRPRAAEESLWMMQNGSSHSAGGTPPGPPLPPPLHHHSHSPQQQTPQQHAPFVSPVLGGAPAALSSEAVLHGGGAAALLPVSAAAGLAGAGAAASALQQFPPHPHLHPHPHAAAAPSSSSRRSRVSSASSTAGSSRRSSGASGSRGAGGGSCRTPGRIYCLLVRGVRCWRAEWHDRSSGHRKTRQYAAPKHGEQQARALCLQALCKARSVPAHLLEEAQQTFDYEPSAPPSPVAGPSAPLQAATPTPLSLGANNLLLHNPQQSQQPHPLHSHSAPTATAAPPLLLSDGAFLGAEAAPPSCAGEALLGGEASMAEGAVSVFSSVGEQPVMGGGMAISQQNSPWLAAPEQQHPLPSSSSVFSSSPMPQAHAGLWMDGGGFGFAVNGGCHAGAETASAGGGFFVKSEGDVSGASGAEALIGGGGPAPESQEAEEGLFGRGDLSWSEASTAALAHKNAEGVLCKHENPHSGESLQAGPSAMFENSFQTCAATGPP